jgi:hypothetical protein
MRLRMLFSPLGYFVFENCSVSMNVMYCSLTWPKPCFLRSTYLSICIYLKVIFRCLRDDVGTEKNYITRNTIHTSSWPVKSNHG